MFIIPLRKEMLVRSFQQPDLLATEIVGISVKLGPATEQGTWEPQSEQSDKERSSPLLF